MTDRREFLQGACLTALPLATGLSFAAPGATREPLAVGAVIIDERHAEARAFGASVAAQGTPVRSVANGDITQLWVSEIGPAWRNGPVPLAGLTRRPVLFCLEQLAWAHNMRVVFHAEHIVAPGGDVQHEVLRCPAAHVGSIAADLARLGAQWPDRLTSLFARHARYPCPQRPGPTCAGLEPDVPAGAALLTSWLIAPV